jgi:hypothetical protein
MKTKNPEDKSGVEMLQLFSSNCSLHGVNKQTQKVKWKGSETRTEKETHQAKAITTHTLTHTHTHTHKEETISLSVEASPVPTEPSHFPRDHVTTACRSTISEVSKGTSASKLYVLAESATPIYKIKHPGEFKHRIMTNDCPY